MTAHLTFSLDAGVATIQFDNPPLQVMTPATINELNALLPRLIEPDVRAVVFGGNRASGYFIRHFSVEELDNTIRGVAIPWDRSMHDVLFDIEHLPKPVISAMDGSAMGGGLEFALAIDIRVAKDGPFRFGLPEISIGILPGAGGTQRLTELLGRGRALNHMLRPKMMTPVEAFAAGVIDELVAADSNETALDRARSIAAEIATRPPRAAAYIKRLVRAAASPVDKDMLKLEGELFADLMTTNEARAGLKGAAAAHRSERTSAHT